MKQFGYRIFMANIKSTQSIIISLVTEYCFWNEKKDINRNVNK